MKTRTFRLFCFSLFLLLTFSLPLGGSGCKRGTSDTASGEPSRTASADSSDYHDPARKGAYGYPGVSVLTVYLVKSDFVDPLTGRLRPSRWQAAKDGVEVWREAVESCGKTFVYVETDPLPDGTRPTVTLPLWVAVSEDRAAFVDPVPGHPLSCRVMLRSSGYGEWTDEQLRVVVAHEAGHVWGLKHSNDERDIMHPASWRKKRARLTERDKATLRKIFARRQH